MQTNTKAACLKRLSRIEGQVLRDNTAMLRMCGELGFHIQADPHDANICLATLSLT